MKFLRKSLLLSLIPLLSSLPSLATSLPSPAILQDSSYEEIADLCPFTSLLTQEKRGKLLLANGLRVFLLSNPSFTKSAASLAMGVGSVHEDPSFPGMAHFVEHMLFQGSLAYPEEDGFSNFVRGNGGESNANTHSIATNFVFSIDHGAFGPALDRFSHFFIDPLFEEKKGEREKAVIEEEWRLRKKRIAPHLVFTSQLHPLSPLASFTCGTAQTLAPLSCRRAALWMSQLYGADRATLVLCSALPLEELKALAVRYFSPLPRASLPLPSVPVSSLPASSQGSLVVTESIDASSQLTCCWELPPTLFAQSGDILKLDAIYEALFNCSAEGPLSFLEKEGEIRGEPSISLITMDTESKGSKLFALNFELTPKGASHPHQVLSTFFRLLSHLKKTPLPIFSSLYAERLERVKKATQLEETDCPYQKAQSEALALLFSPTENFSLWPVPPFCSLEEQELASLWESLTPKKGIYLLATPLKERDLNSKERWTGAPYGVFPLDCTALEEWEETPPLPTFSHLLPNPFLSTKELFPPFQKEERPLSALPLTLIEETGELCYFLQEKEFQTPYIYWAFDLYTESGEPSPKQAVLNELLGWIWRKNTRSLRCQGGKATIFLESFSPLVIYGLPEKAPLFLQKVLEAGKQASLSKEEFAKEKEAMDQWYAPPLQRSPLEKADKLYRKALILDPLFFLSEEKREALRLLSYEEYTQYAATFPQSYSVKSFFSGQMDEGEAREVYRVFENLFPGTPHSHPPPSQVHVLSLPEDGGPFCIEEEGESENNTLYLTLQQGEWSFERGALNSLLFPLLDSDFFAFARSTHQLAYLVKADWRRDRDQLAFIFCLESSAHSPLHLLRCTEEFVQDYTSHFSSYISPERFALIKNSQLEELRQPFTSFQEKASYLSSIALSEERDFEKRSKWIAALEELTYEKFQEEALRVLSPANTKRLAILINKKGVGEEGMENKAAPYQGVDSSFFKERIRSEEHA